MQKMSWLIFCGALCIVPAAAKAGFVLESSLGYGFQMSPETRSDSSNIMIAPGFSIADIVRAELGVVGSWDAAKNRDTSRLGLQLRPMLVIAPPLFPVYGRLVVASIRPFSSERTFAYGGALGVSASLVGIGLFAEAGLLPRSIDSQISWVMEGRAGLYFSL